MISHWFKRPTDKVAPIILVLAGVLGATWQYFFFDKALGLAFPLFMMLLILGFYAVVLHRSERNHRLAAWLVLPLLFFSWMVFVRENTTLAVFNVLISIYLFLLLSYTVANASSLTKRIAKALGESLILPFIYIRDFFGLLKKIPNPTIIGDHNKSMWYAILRGALVTVPIVCVFLLLFISADAGFGEFARRLFTWDFSLDAAVVWRICLGVAMAILIGGAYAYSLYQAEDESKEVVSESKQGKTWLVEVMVLLTSLNVLFFFFIVIQSTYLFGGETVIQSLGLTFSEYARKGFFELLAASILTFVILWVCDHFQQKKSEQNGYIFKIASIVLIVQTLLIMVSAFYRLALYEAAFGFTESRLYAHVIIIWLGFILAFLVYKILVKANQSVFIRAIIISFLVVIGILNIANPEAFIVNRNIARYQAMGDLDGAYLLHLSDDAVPAIANALNSGVVPRLSQLELLLTEQKESIVGFKKYTDWQSLRISHINAQRALDSYGH